MFDKLKLLKTAYKEFKVSPFVVLSFLLSIGVYFQNKSVLDAKDKQYKDVIYIKDEQIKQLLIEKNEYKTIALEMQREKQINNLLNSK